MTQDRTATGGLLWLRALVLSLVAWTTGALAHVGADGLLPGVPTLLGLLLLGTLLGVPLLRRPATALRTCVLVVLGQQAVHLALSVTAGHAGLGEEPGGEAGHHLAHAGLHERLHEGLHHALEGPLDEPGMTAAHLLAAVVCGWWLARGEQALWLVLDLAGHAAAALATLVAALAALLGRPVPTTPDLAPAGADRTAWSDPRPPVLRLLARSVGRRGPPALVAA